jgi:dimethylglycine dehydrogenase
MKSGAHTVIIGGGVVGCSVAFHLARLGVHDVVLLERRELTAGSTWHAAGGYHSLNGNPNMARLQHYTVQLYRELAELSGRDIGLHATGGISVAATEARWNFLQYEAARHRVLGIASRLITPEEIGALCPIIDVRELRGGLYMEDEGHVDPYGVTHAYAAAARRLGAEIRRHVRVVALQRRAGGTWTVVTDRGEIDAVNVVNAAGLWAREIGAMAGVALPLVPMEHHYLITGPIPALERRGTELPTVVDLDGEIYLRQERSGVLLGVYETPATPWAVDGTPWDFGEDQLLPDDLDRLESALHRGFRRFPLVEQAGIRKVVNGPFTFTPDGNPLVGPVPGAPGFWCACGVMAGFAQGGGVGLALAEWLVHGHVGYDVSAMDVARFGEYADRRFVLAKASEFYERRFRLAFPNEYWPAARDTRVSALHGILRGRGAVFGVSDAMEYPLYFAGSGEARSEAPTFLRSNAFPATARECRRARNDATVLDISSYGRLIVSGAHAAAWLSTVLASRLPAPGRARLGLMLSPRGHVLGEFTVLRPAGPEFMLVGSGAMQRMHMRWLLAHLPADGPLLQNASTRMGGLALNGPRAPEILAALAGENIRGAAFPHFAVRTMTLAEGSVIVARISFTGEPGYELHCDAAHLPDLYHALRDAAAGCGAPLEDMGFYALNSLRLEKGYGIWSREYSPDFLPAACGLDRLIDFDRPGFIGRDAVLAQRAQPPPRRLVTMEILAPDRDAWGYEPIWHGETLAGFTTSGGYGHCVGRSLAKGYVDAAFARGGIALAVDLPGGRVPLRVLEVAPWDPGSTRLRD